MIVYLSSRSPTWSWVGSIIIVLIVVGLLGAIMLPGFWSAREHGQNSGCGSNLKNIATALDMYGADNPLPHMPGKGKLPRRLEQLTPGYFKVLPTCPKAGRITYTYLYADEPGIYTVYCRGVKHLRHKDRKGDYPQYDSVQGLIDP
jgi:type II secretory pathway pseudopilin PulG